MTDEEILTLYYERNDSAIAQTSAKYGAPLTHMALKFVGHEDAEECVNDTYLSAWNHIPPERPAIFRAWLLKVCRNHVISRFRWGQADKRSAELVEFSDELAQCLPDRREEQRIESEEIGNALSEFLRTLPEEKRIMFLRRYWFGDTVSEVADRLGCTESKVKVTLFRVRGQLKEYLEQEGIAL